MLRLQFVVPLVVAAAYAPSNAFAGDHECMVKVSKAKAKAEANTSRASTDEWEDDDHDDQDDDWEEDADEAPAKGRVTVFLNPARTTLRGGWDDASRNVSALVASRGNRSMRVPGWRGTRRNWNSVVSCVRKGMSAFDIDVVTKRPTSGSYIMAMMGGRSSMLGYRGSISGVAPYSGRVMRKGVVFVFASTMRHRARSVCETTLHEVGHALGLDHSYDCKDLMGYRRCGAKKFMNRARSCGEYRRRSCSNRARTQNSYQHLMSVVGPRKKEPTTVTKRPPPVSKPPPQPPRPTAPDPRPDDWRRDSTAPSVALVSPSHRATVAGNRYVQIVIRARDKSGISRVELAWATPDSNHLLQCDAMPRGVPASCSRRGDLYTFRMLVGTGLRAFAVRATDRAGNHTISNVVELSFSQ